MQLSVCEGCELRLCASCARNVDNQPAPRNGVDTRQWIQPVTRGERCFDWYPQPPQPTPPATGK